MKMDMWSMTYEAYIPGRVTVTIAMKKILLWSPMHVYDILREQLLRPRAVFHANLRVFNTRS